MESKNVQWIRVVIISEGAGELSPGKAKGRSSEWSGSMVLRYLAKNGETLGESQSSSP
jgi:hypothetical protein